MVDISEIIKVALTLHTHRKEHRTVEVEVGQEHDAIGASIRTRFLVPMPPGAMAVANLESAWGRILGSHDDRVFRDESSDFHTLAPVTSQLARLYIPYGVVRHRKAGIYTRRAVESDVLDTRPCAW